MGTAAAILAVLLLLGGIALAAPGGADVRSAARAGRRILLVGNALTLGYAPAVALPPGAVLEGFTWSGRGVAPLLARLADYLAHQPTDVVVLLEGDDLASSAGVGAAAADLRRVWADVKRTGARLYAVQLVPASAQRPDDATGVMSLNAFILAASREAGGPDVVVRTATLGDADGRLRPEFGGGGRRLSPAGLRALAHLVGAALGGV